MVMRGIVALIALLLAAASASAFVVVEHWQPAEDDLYGEFVENTVTLDTDDLDPDTRIKTVFTIPELGVRASKGPYDAETRHSRVQRTLWLPEGTEPGEYVIRMTVTDNHGNKRIRHRFVEIE